MSLHDVMVDGTLQPDGTTVKLDQSANVLPGRVKVTLQSVPAQTVHQRGIAHVIDEINRDQQARGFQGRSSAEIKDGLQEGEDEYEKRMQAIRSQTNTDPPSEGS